MRTLRLLAASLLFAVCVGFSSCGDKELDYVYSTIGGGEMSSESICKEYGITDYENIDLFNGFVHSDNTMINKGQANFAGLKNNHLWIATYDNSSKDKLAEGTCNSEFQLSCKVFKEFEGYRDMTISKLVPMWNHIITPSQFIATFQYEFKEDATESLYSTLFYNNGKSKEIRGLGDGVIFNWYDNSVLIRPYCYTLDGDSICSFIFPQENGGLTETYSPISYSEVIYRLFNDKGAFIGRWNGTTKQRIWFIELKELSSFINNDKYKVDFKLSDSSTNVWKFDATITSYDGSKESLKYNVNIEDGKVDVAGEGIKVTGVTLNKSQVLLDLGDTFQLVDTVKPNYAENNKVVWTSSNESVATVDQNGLVTAKSYGEAMITVTTEDGGFSATADVTVKAREISDYIASKLNVGVVNLGGYIQCAINCELVNDSKDDVELTSYTILDENEKILLKKSYDHTVLGAKSSYSEGAYVNGTFSELILRWTYVHKGKEYTYTTRYKVKNS